jgi:hypothetical protein
MDHLREMVLKPTTGSSACCSETWRWTAVSPRPLAAARRRVGALWTGEKQGIIKRSTVVDGSGISLGAVRAPANRHDSPLLPETLDALRALGPLPERMSVHLDRIYDSEATHQRLHERGLETTISEKGKPAPLSAGKRWVVRAHELLAQRPQEGFCGAPSGGGESSTSRSPSPR